MDEFAMEQMSFLHHFLIISKIMEEKIMKKKILSAILCATTMFSAVGFSSCQVTDVAQLQEAINEKEEQIAQLEQDKQDLEGQVEDLESELAKYESLIVEQEVNDMVEFKVWYFTSGVPNNQIIFHCPIEGVLFECIREDAFGWDGQGMHEYSVSAEKSFSWSGYADVTKTYVDVYVKLGDNYVGYAVIEINIKDYQATPTLLKSVMFPKLWGEYQQVSKEEVKVLIEKAKI